MNLAQLQYFVKLAELEHFTKTAEQLYITQPTLSNAISKLEDELGVMLFEREGRNVHLTKYGRDFRKYAQQALECLEQGKDLAREQAGEHSGNVDIGTIFTIQDNYLPALIRQHRSIYGDGTVFNIFQGLTSALIEDLENDRYDVAFCAYVPNHDKVEFTHVLSQSIVAMVHADHPLASKEEISLSDLHGVHLVTYRYNTPLGREVQFLLQEEHLMPTEQYDDEITLASMSAANPNAIALALNTLGFAPFDDLIPIPLKNVPRDFHPVYLVYKKGTYKTPAVRKFIELVKSNCLETNSFLDGTISRF